MHFGQMGVSQRPQASLVSTFGCRAHRISPLSTLNVLPAPWRG